MSGSSSGAPSASSFVHAPVGLTGSQWDQGSYQTHVSSAPWSVPEADGAPTHMHMCIHTPVLSTVVGPLREAGGSCIQSLSGVEQDNEYLRIGSQEGRPHQTQVTA